MKVETLIWAGVIAAAGYWAWTRYGKAAPKSAPTESLPSEEPESAGVVHERTGSNTIFAPESSAPSSSSSYSPLQRPTRYT